MSQTIKAIRGMNDILPEQIHYWQHIENALRKLTQAYGYQEIRMPVVESTELFCRSIGEVTDIVEKEMYSFEDRNGDSLTLRPEGTAGGVRAGIEHGLFYNQTQKLWYMGPMYRHERPQKGRYRQFYQFGLEAFGFATPDIDAEMILFAARLWHQLGLQDHIQLQINSLGTPEVRKIYRQQLVDYLQRHREALDSDSLRRLDSNPLRVLDSKNPDMADLIANAPKLTDYLDEESQQHFQQLCAYLDATGIPYQINPCLVRGLDYYSKTVFEWVTTELGAQGTVCAGGRYDGLVEQLGGKPTPAFGFAMGIERLVLMLEAKNKQHIQACKPAIYIVCMGDAATTKALQIAEAIRTHIPHLSVLMHCGGGSFKSQFKKADKSGAEAAFIIGDDEVVNQTIGIKYLRKDLPQEVVEDDNLIEFLIDSDLSKMEK